MLKGSKKMTNNDIKESDIFPKGFMKKLLVPLIIEQFLGITIGLADTVMVSGSGEAAISGVSLVDQINVLLMQTFAALATGGAVIVSQYLGRGERDRAQSAVKQLTLISFYVSSFIAVLCFAFCPQILRLIFGNVEADVMTNCKTYFYISVVSYPFLALYNSGAAVFRSMGKSKITMVTSVLMNVINLVGNAILILGFGLGVFGAAAATLASRTVGGIIMTVLIRNKRNEVYLTGLKRPTLELKIIKKILYIGIPSGLEGGMFQVGKLLVARVVSDIGTAATAANATAGIIASIPNIPGSAISLAIVTVVGRAMGAKLPAVAEKHTKRLIGLTYILMFCMNVIIFVLIEPIVGLFSLSTQATADAVGVVRSFCIVSSAIWPIAFTLPSCLRASGDVKFSMYVAIFSMWLCRVALCYVLCYTFEFGLYGVWFAMYADWVVRSVFYGGRFLQGKWKKITIV